MATRTDRSFTPLSDEAIRSLIEIGRALSDEPDLSVAFKRVVRAMADVIKFDRLAISIVDLVNQTVTDTLGSGAPIAERAAHEARPLAGTIAEALISQTGAFIVDADLQKDPVNRFPILQRSIDAGFRTGISVPLRTRDELIGVLHVRSFATNAYSPGDIAYIESVSRQLAGPLASEQLRVRLEQGALEESVLAEMSRILTSGMQIQDMYERIGQQVKRLVPYQRMVIAVADPETGTGRDEYVAGIGVANWSPGLDKPLDESLTGYMAREIKAVYVFEGEDDFTGVIPSEDRHRESLGLAALISVPIVDQGALIGNINVREKELSAYTLDDVRKMERVADQIAGMVANQKLHDSISQQASEREVLAEIGRTINSTLRLEEVLERFAVQARKLIPFDRIVISRVVTETNDLVDTYVSGREVQGYAQGGKHELSSNVTSQAVLSGRPIAWNRDALESLAAEMDPAADALKSGLNSLLITPLIWQGGVVGTVNFRSVLPNPYGPEEIRLAEEISAQIAGAITTTRLYEESERQSAIREGLAEIGRIMASSLDAQEVFPRCADQIARLIPFDRLAIVLLNEEAGTKTDLYSIGVDIPGQEPGIVSPLANSLATEIINSGKPRIMDATELAAQAERFPGTHTRVQHGLNSLISAPLISRGRTIGILNLRSKEHSAYSADQLELVSLISAQIAGSLATSTLYARSEEESKEREALAEIGRIITSSPDIEKVYERFADQARELIPHDRIVITLLEDGGNAFVDAFVSGVEIPGYTRGKHYFVGDTSNREVVHSRKTIATNDEDLVIPEGEVGTARLTADAGLKSRLVTPLFSQGEVIGTLNFRSKLLDAYGASEIRLAEQIGAQIAGAIATSQLHRLSEREAEIREGLAAIAEAAASDLQLDQILEGIADRLASVIPFDRLSVTLVDVDDPRRLRVAYISGVQVPGYAVGDTVAINPDGEGQPWSWQAGIETDLGGAGGPAFLRRAGEDLGIESWMEVPLGSPDESPAGFLGLRSGESHEYTDADLEVLKRVAAQITPSISNSRLHEQLQTDARERELLAEIGRVISNARDVTEMFNEITDLARQLIPFDGIGLANLDHDADTLTMGEVRSLPNIITVKQGSVFPLYPSLSGDALKQMATVVYCPEEESGISERSALLAELYRSGARSFMAAPLVSQREMLGTLIFQSSTVKAYGPEQARLADRLARQIAGKVESARYQVQLQQEAHTSELLAEISRVIGSSIDVSEMFARFQSLARELLPIDGIGIAIINSEAGTFIMREVDTGRDDTQAAGSDGAPRRLEGSLTGEAYRRAETVVYCAEDGDEPPKHYPGLAELHKIGGRSFMAVPLISNGETRGVLIMYAKATGAFSESDKEMAERLANQIAGKLEIANLMADVSKLAATVDASPDFISLSDPELRLEYTNPAGLDLMGMLPPDETDAVRLPDLFTRDDARRLESEGLAQALRVGFWWAELEALRSDGSSLPVEALLVPIKDSSGAVQALSLQFRDISRRVAIQEALEESEEHYRDLFENAEELIQTADGEGNILYVNRAWLRRLGYQSGEISSMTIWDIVHPDGLEHCREVFAKIAKGEPVGEFDAEFVTKTGQKVFVRGTTNYRFEDGRPISTRGIFRDVGARLEVERMKNEFVSMVSHELRTPLTSIRGSLGMLASGLLEDQPEQAHRMLEIASANTDRLVRLINDILDIERIESGAVDVDLAVVDAGDVIEQAAEEMQAFADDAAVRLDVRAGTAWIIADRDRVVQTLTNLISNAVKFSEPESTVTIDCRQTEDRVIFSVADSGRGIPPDKIDTIFERFQQADSSDSRDKGGTGLGLAICRMIIEQHGGEIYVESEMGAGSTFSFWLKRGDELDITASATPAGSRLSAAGQAGGAGDE